MSIIIRLSNRAFPARGGVEVSVHETSKRLVKRGHKVIVICYQPASGGPVEEVLEGVDYFRRPFNVNVKSALRLIHSLYGNIDLLSYEDFPAFEDGSLKELSGAKHDLYYAHGWEGVVPPGNSIISVRRKVNSVCDYTIEVGEFISKWYGTVPDFVSYGGYPEGNLEKARKVNKNYISWIGRLAKDTGFEQVVESIWKVGQHAEFTFEVFGDGALRHLVPPKGLFRGFVQNPIEQALGVVVLCSGYLSILEALSMNSTVVSYYDNDVKRDYLLPLRDCIYMSNSVDDYQRLLSEALAGKLPEKVEGRKKFLEENSWSKTCDVIEKMALGEFPRRPK